MHSAAPCRLFPITKDEAALWGMSCRVTQVAPVAVILGPAGGTDRHAFPSRPTGDGWGHGACARGPSLHTEYARIMRHLDDFLGLCPTHRGRREVLFSFAIIISQHSGRGPLSPVLLDSNWAPPLVMGLGNVARVYAREVGRRMMQVTGIGASTTLTPEFVVFIDRPVKSVCDLLAYESSSESSSEPASCRGSSGYNQLRECLTTIISEDPPEGS